MLWVSFTKSQKVPNLKINWFLNMRLSHCYSTHCLWQTAQLGTPQFFSSNTWWLSRWGRCEKHRLQDYEYWWKWWTEDQEACGNSWGQKSQRSFTSSSAYSSEHFTFSFLSVLFFCQLFGQLLILLLYADTTIFFGNLTLA